MSLGGPKSTEKKQCCLISRNVCVFRPAQQPLWSIISEIKCSDWSCVCRDGTPAPEVGATGLFSSEEGWAAHSHAHVEGEAATGRRSGHRGRRFHRGFYRISLRKSRCRKVWNRIPLCKANESNPLPIHVCRCTYVLICIYMLDYYYIWVWKEMWKVYGIKIRLLI